MKKILKKNKSLIITGLVLIAVILAYFKRESIKTFFSKSKPSSPLNVSTATASPSTTPTTPIVPNEDDVLLKKGSSGLKVKELQVLMNNSVLAVNPNNPTLATDGNFGAKTEDRLEFLTGRKSISINQYKEMDKKGNSGSSWFNIF